MGALAEDVGHLGRARSRSPRRPRPGPARRPAPRDQAATSSQWRKHWPFLALLAVGAALAEGEQAGEPRPAGAVLGPDQQRGAVHQVEPAAGDQPHAGRRRRRASALTSPPTRVAVGDAERGIAEQGGGREQFLRAGDAAQEAEMAGDLELDIGHPNTPCRCQLRSPVRGSSPSPRRNSQKRRAVLVLDLEIVADRLGLAACAPPFAMDPLGPVGGGDAIGAGRAR